MAHSSMLQHWAAFILLSASAHAATQSLQLSGCGNIGKLELSFSSVATVDSTTSLAYQVSRNAVMSVDGVDYPAALLPVNTMRKNDNKVRASSPYVDTYGVAFRVAGCPNFTTLSISEIKGQPSQYQGVTNNGQPVVIGCLKVYPAGARPILQGCFNDAKPPAGSWKRQYPARVFPNVTVVDGGVSVDKCADIAQSQGWPYFGIQNSNECWWGHSTYDSATEYGKNSAVCNAPCPVTDYVIGDKCGGHYTYSLYKLAPGQ